MTSYPSMERKASLLSSITNKSRGSMIQRGFNSNGLVAAVIVMALAFGGSLSCCLARHLDDTDSTAARRNSLRHHRQASEDVTHSAYWTRNGRAHQRRHRRGQESTESDTAPTTIPNQYIFLYQTNVSDVPYKTKQLLHRVQQRLSHPWRTSSSLFHENDVSTLPTPSILYTFSRHNFKGSVITGMTSEQAQDILDNDSDIRLVEQDFWLHADDTDTDVATQDRFFGQRPSADEVVDETVNSAPSWGLDRINQQSLPLDSNTQHSFTGAGVDVYILDSGIFPNHDEFQDTSQPGSSSSTTRALCSYDAYTQNNAHCYDGTGHGTHVAGTIGGLSFGVAKDVRLLSVKVLDADGNGRASHVIAGIQHVVNQTVQSKSSNGTRRPTVVNLSFGGQHSDVLNEAVQAAVGEGIVFVTSAGNDSRRACQQSPASSESVITVAASNEKDRAAMYSNFGKCVDIFGPGSDIRSAWNTGINDTMVVSGTSMASPHVAGVAALYLERDPTMTPAAVREALTRDAVPDALLLMGLHAFTGSPNLLLNTEALVSANR